MRFVFFVAAALVLVGLVVACARVDIVPDPGFVVYDEAVEELVLDGEPGLESKALTELPGTVLVIPQPTATSIPDAPPEWIPTATPEPDYLAYEVEELRARVVWLEDEFNALAEEYNALAEQVYEASSYIEGLEQAFLISRRRSVPISAGSSPVPCLATILISRTRMPGSMTVRSKTAVLKRLFR